ncbi:glycerophosphodiester phosphodiesterase [Flaviflexus equikiangi]|uniref:Glycerophosphodiester phosphodiesterase n=1 Tax=Flaviflexus equikiangi TaxID=2758573 RepID=A0ABS2THC3_9ACTO|nr:glycerophosphodiester phosphodiesterase [Flaviflexus equikiangi]MBM9433498.1 glycerophosphodiester phosphodiesterase [Flaviflexus equikiangi]
MKSWERTGTPVVIAHRGGADEYPENSVEAFSAMVDRGFTYIETDVHATADGRLVLMHDPDLDRTTTGSGPISDATWEYVSTLRDGSGRRPMLLTEALEMFPTVDFNVDLKVDSTVEPMIELLTASEYRDRILLASFSEARLRRVRRAVPGVATSMGTSAIAQYVLTSRIPGPCRDRLLDFFPGPEDGAVCVQMPERFRGRRILDDTLIDMLHRRGIAVHVWTINEAMDMERLIGMGVDGLVTDRPTLAREVIGATRA